MPTRYDAASIESKWYAAWEAAGLFQPSADASKESFCITIPPPNITGSLHMGHALCYPLQDAIGRYQRLLGKSVLILPGQDHAGIATQSVVEKQLRKEGSSGAQIGREKFVERVWEWRESSGATILNQMRLFGCAFDWSRSRFTLDEEYAGAVLKVFIDWFDRGLIFKGKRVVNWDPVLKTSVSDIETERRTVKGKLYYISYPFADGSGAITIATTRPETMLGDVAVAVHPSDKRYEGKIGKMLRLPLMNRDIPLIADIYPDPSFGSGAVKITPAHDPNDFQVGQRHGLEMPVILDERAKVTEAGGKYAGLDRLEARKQIVADLEILGFLVKIEDHEINLIVSERSGEVIEPLLSEQWFCDQAKLAAPVIKAVEAGEIKFHPDRFDRIFIDWLTNIKEWCLSRQLWWGHRIPVFYTEDGRAVAAANWEAAEAKAREKIVRQDDDVLDTWFSSGLWPFATLGWPNETEDLKRFYPTNTLVTDRNIINLWVARMAMMGFDEAGSKPFSDVMIYATVLTENGQRMSKSLGTGVDPIGVLEKIGADAMRYTLQSQTGSNQDLRYSERRTEEARNFCNKIWNATRFVLMNIGDTPPEKPKEFEILDKWLLSRLARTEAAVRKAYDSFDFQLVCSELYRFFWNEVCDWYIEVSKVRLNKEETRSTPQWVLLHAVSSFLTMLSPVMPHITEELYSYLPLEGKADFLMSADWPKLDQELVDEASERKVERVLEIIRNVRAMRASLGIPAMRYVPLAYISGDTEGLDQLLSSQTWISELKYESTSEKVVSTSINGVELHLPIGDLLDIDKELARLENEQVKLTDEIRKLKLRLDNPQFVERAKPEVIERDRAQVAELEARLANNAERAKLFKN